jgi:hypothetical protein
LEKAQDWDLAVQNLNPSLLAGYPWANLFNSFSLSFLTYKAGVRMPA